MGLESLCLEDLTAHAAAGNLGQALAQAMQTQYAGPLLQTPLDRTATLLGDRYGFLAGRYTNCSACAAGTQVLGEAWQMLCEGQAAVALAGAADSMLNPLGLGGFSLLRVLSDENDRPQQACRPFDATRQGRFWAKGRPSWSWRHSTTPPVAGRSSMPKCSGYGSSLDAFAVSDPDPSGRGAVAVHAAGDPLSRA